MFCCLKYKPNLTTFTLGISDGALLWHSDKWLGRLAKPPLSFPCGSTGKESACNGGDLSSINGLGRAPREGNDYSLQYSGLENSMDCVVHGITKSQA